MPSPMITKLNKKIPRDFEQILFQEFRKNVFRYFSKVSNIPVIALFFLQILIGEKKLEKIRSIRRRKKSVCDIEFLKVTECDRINVFFFRIAHFLHIHRPSGTRGDFEVFVEDPRTKAAENSDIFETRKEGGKRSKKFLCITTLMQQQFFKMLQNVSTILKSRK